MFIKTFFGVLKLRMIMWALGNQKSYKNLVLNISCKESIWEFGKDEWEDFRERAVQDVNWIELMQNKVYWFL